MNVLSAEKILDCCEANWEAHKADCSGFVKAVAHDLGYSLHGNADDITTTLRGLSDTTDDGATAARWASEGRFVIAGLEGAKHHPSRTHGHVVVVVAGLLAHEKYPTAYWEALGGEGNKRQTTNWAWNHADRDHVTFGAMPLPIA